MAPYPMFWCGLAVLLIYWPALAGQLVYDDSELILQNPPLRNGDLSQLLGEPFYVGQIGYWRPLAALLMSAAWQLAGPVGIHALALLAHALAGACAFRLSLRAFGDGRYAALATLLFLWHPVQVESVAWCSAVSGPIAGFLVLLAIELALRWRDLAATGEHRHAWLAATACLAALLAKESAVAGLPLVLAAIAWLPDRPQKLPWRRILIPMAIAAILWTALRLSLLSEPFGTTDPNGTALPVLHALSASGELFVRHLGLLAVPWPLTAFHPFDQSPATATALAFSVTAILVLGIGVFAARRATGATRFALAAITVPLLPHVAAFQVVGTFPLTERYLYLSAFGFGLLVIAWLANRPQLLPLPTIAVVVLAAIAFVHTGSWQDQRALIENGLHHAPDDPLLHVMRGNLELRAAEGGDDRALLAARHAFSDALATIRIDPRSREVVDAGSKKARNDARVGLAWCELFTQQQQERFDPPRLVRAFEKAIAGEATAAAWVGLGIGYELDGNDDRARHAWRQALALDERCAEAWYYLARLNHLRGQSGRAREQAQRAVHCNPDFRAAHELLTAIQ
ncbi:MAG: hypothetical protein NXI31_26465 [bacterium]|nr:hypothetical protein [bacterium]